MAVYNYKQDNRYIFTEAIESILNQTYSNFEFIICDDGSTNETYQILESFAKKDSRIVLLKNERNMGIAFSSNKCFSVAKGEYIARMDADDISLPERLEKQVAFLDKYPEFAFVSCNCILFDGNGDWGKLIYTELPEKEDFLFTLPFENPANMMRKVIFDKVNGYKVGWATQRSEDYDFFLRCYAEGFYGYNLQEFLFKYREDAKAYKRRGYKHRLGETIVRFNGFKKLGLLPRNFLYVIKPLIVGLIPQSLLSVLRNRRNKVNVRD